MAAITMVFNEPEYLPVWLRHYAGELGEAQCHVIDHGSDDGSIEAVRARYPRATYLRLPRTPHDDRKRAALISDYQRGLLHYFDAVLYTDVDEMVVAQTGGLAACAGAGLPDVACAIGFNLLHLSAEQPALDRQRGIGLQRDLGWFLSAMCKPVLVQRPTLYSPGFHSGDAPVRFAPLYLFHLRYADREVARARLGRTRAMAWANGDAGAHQRISDAELGAMLDRLEAMDRIEGVSFDPDRPPLRDWLDRVAQSALGREDAVYRIALDIENYQLWRIPAAIAARIAPARL